ncbi:hypothetical protein SLEP1_g16723 [Rubroshorea leprosula]|uniref:Uncharacterized protein n=1 Tax=Rubroshorea leprosula TaxID=152421 RepID=A0AAV5IXL3_9ROSI|nr:hypothetical protein SLEP1_g16723 [Rubroshorea leprosula]
MAVEKYGGCHDNELRDQECAVSRREVVNTNEHNHARNGSCDVEQDCAQDVRDRMKVRQKDIKEREVTNVGYRSSSRRSDFGSSGGGNHGPKHLSLGSVEPPALGSREPTPGFNGTQARVPSVAWVPWNPGLGSLEPRRGFHRTQRLGLMEPSAEPNAWVRWNPSAGFHQTWARVRWNPVLGVPPNPGLGSGVGSMEASLSKEFYWNIDPPTMEGLDAFLAKNNGSTTNMSLT